MKKRVWIPLLIVCVLVTVTGMIWLQMDRVPVYPRLRFAMPRFAAHLSLGKPEHTEESTVSPMYTETYPVTFLDCPGELHLTFLKNVPWGALYQVTLDLETAEGERTALSDKLCGIIRDAWENRQGYSEHGRTFSLNRGAVGLFCEVETISEGIRLTIISQW